MQLKLYGTLQVFLFVYAARNTGAVLTFNINSLTPVFSKHFVKFLRTPILWNTSELLLLYIARLMSVWRKVCFQFIGSSFDLIISKLQTKEMLLICLQIQDKICNYFKLSIIHSALIVASRVTVILLSVQYFVPSIF